MKKSFASCKDCVYHDDNGKICETNTKDNILNLDRLYIIDNVNEWESLKNIIKKDNKRYLITSPVLCGDPNNKSAVSVCKDNMMEIYKKCNPKETIIIGPISKVNCTITTGLYEFNNLNEFELSRNEVDILSSFKNETFVLKENPPMLVADKFIPKNETNQVYMFTIPDKYYTDEYRLLDVQTISSQSRVIYLFRDKNNNKEFYEVPIKSDDFYWYESSSNDNKIIEKYENLQLKIGNYKERNQTTTAYGGDTNLTMLHAADYYMQSKGEAPIVSKNILHYDIEIYTYREKTFPDPEIAQYPINAISFRHCDAKHTSMYLLKINGEIDPRIDAIIASNKYPSVTVFTDEYTLLSSFLNKIQELKPDFITGWNSSEFDLPYVVNRMKKLSIPMKNLSPYGNVYADARGKGIVTGYISVDQLKLFKNDTTRPVQSSYKLDSIAELITGKRKVQYDGDLNDLYNKDIDTFIDYSITDTNLVKEIEDITQHIAIFDELRRITTNSQSGASSTIGQADGLFLTSMKKKGLIARNSKHSEKESLIGAYVFDARGGLYSGLICDFDFQSLYPSIINTWNIGPDTLLAVIDEEVAFDYIYRKDLLTPDSKIEVLMDPIHKSMKTKMTIAEFDSFIEKNKATINCSGTIFIGHELYESIFNTAVGIMFNGRKVYKKKMLECKEKNDRVGEIENNGKQMAYKILANSLYGVLSNEHFKFYNNSLAKSITMSGRELLKYCTVHCDNFMSKRRLNAEFKFDHRFMERVTELKDVIYGDTDSAFVYLTDYLNDLGIEVKKSPEVQKVIDTIQSHINKPVIDYFLACHNIPREKSLIYLKNEFLFSKYYTLNGKKHYAMRIISQEGKDISGVEIKGIEIRRSDTPLKSRELLSKIIDIILDEKVPKDKILDIIDELVIKTRLDMLDLIDKRDNRVVKTVSYSSPLNEYKQIPSHVHAMLKWNLIVNEDFRYGNKGKLWNIKAIDLNKAPESIKDNYYNKYLKKYQASDLDCICLPEDVPVLPDYFILDTKKIIEFCCDDRVNILIEPLKKKSNLIMTF